MHRTWQELMAFPRFLMVLYTSTSKKCTSGTTYCPFDPRISVCWDIIFKCIILYSANQEYNSLLRSQKAETAKYKAMLKKTEVKTSSFEDMLEQKVKENDELVSICDELINERSSE